MSASAMVAGGVSPVSSIIPANCIAPTPYSLVVALQYVDLPSACAIAVICVS